MQYRKRPIVIEAYQWNHRGNFIKWDALPSWIRDTYERGDFLMLADGAEIKTLEGWIKASIGDWIIRGIAGELYPCKPDIFDATYEAAP